MTAQEIFWTAMAIVVCVILPICMVIGASRHLRGDRREEVRAGDSPIGSALQELDRIVARPSVKYTIEAEKPFSSETKTAAAIENRYEPRLKEYTIKKQRPALRRPLLCLKFLYSNLTNCF